MRRDQFTEAGILFDRLLTIDSKFSQSYDGKSLICRKQGINEKALKLIEKGPKCADGSSLKLYKYNKVIILFRMKLFDEALAEINDLIATDPQNDEYLAEKGIILANMEKKEEALEYFDQALIYNNKNSDAITNKANILYNLDRFEEALPWYNRCIENNTDHVQSYINKSRTLINLNRYHEAIKTLTIAIEKDPNSIEAYYRRGFVYLFDLNNEKEAVKDLQTARYLYENNMDKNLDQKTKELLIKNLKLIIDLEKQSNIFNDFLTNENIKKNPKLAQVKTKFDALQTQKKQMFENMKQENFINDEKSEAFMFLYQKYEELNSEITQIKSDVNKINVDLSNIKLDLNNKLNDYKAILETELEAMELVKIDKQKIWEYFLGFMSTFSNIYTTSVIIDSGKIALDTSDIKISIFSSLCSLAPFAGKFLADGIRCIGDFVKKKSFIEKVRKIKSLFTDPSDVTQTVGESLITIIKNEYKKDKILDATPETIKAEVNGLIAKLQNFFSKIAEKINVNLYGQVYKTCYAKFGNLDANSCIEYILQEESKENLGNLQKIISDFVIKRELKEHDDETINGYFDQTSTKCKCCLIF